MTPVSRQRRLSAIGARVRRWVRVLGPGIITGAADDDPSGISTYSIAGASAGYSLLWTALFTTPMMAVVQGMCARIAIVSGRGLAGAMALRFPRWVVRVLVLIVVVANTANLGADLVGMGAAAQLVIQPVPAIAWAVAFALICVVTEVFTSYAAFAKIVKWLCLGLFSYVITAFIVHLDWPRVLLHAILPEVHANHAWIATLLGVLGTTITPYLFFWQSALEVEEERKMGRTMLEQRLGATEQEVSDAAADVNLGTLYSNVVMFFIIATTAATLGAHGVTTIATAEDAAKALRPLAGDFAFLLFALGVVGAGLLAVPVLAGSSAYAFADAFDWREGLAKRPRDAPAFYVVLVAGVALGLALPTVFHVDPIRALFWSAIGNGIAAVPLLWAITFLANDRRIMGRWTNSRLANVWAWATVTLMSLTTLALFVPL